MDDHRQLLLTVNNLRTDFIVDAGLQLPFGTCMGLHGPSGSGKSLLLRAIADMDVNSGELFLENRPREDFTASQWRRKVGLLPAESHWWTDQVGDHSHDWPLHWLEKLGFSKDVLQWQCSRLSSGEKQRLALVRLLANHPRVLLLDEPTANLDAANTQAVENLLLDYLQAEDAGAIWVSHDPGQLRRIAAFQGTMSQGRLKLEDS